MLVENSREKLKPLFIRSRELSPRSLGFLELSRDEQIAKKIYEATGDKTFKGFLPKTWNTAQVVKMRDIHDTLKAAGKLTAFNMAMKYPGVSMAAHQYFITNANKIKGILPDSTADILKPLNPILIVAGLAATAFILVQITPFLKAGKK